MVEKVKKFICAHSMLSDGDRVIVGLSGGPDSVVLLHVLKSLQSTFGIELFAAHVNHGLRGEDADEDARFSEELCRQWGIPFFLKKADIRELSQLWKKSEEEAGRLVRYGFFDEVSAEVNGTKIATAHHKNDQAETILHHIIRGTGLQGLSGIRPVRDGRIIRPLLDVSRKEIHDYIMHHGLIYRTDASNESSAYTRNRIRIELLPGIEAGFNPNIVDSLASMGSIVREDDEFLTMYCDSRYAECALQEAGNVSIRLDRFLSYHIAVRKRLVRRALQHVRGSLDGIGSVHIEDAVGLAEYGSVGSVLHLPGGIRIVKGYNEIRFALKGEKAEPEAFDLPVDIPSKVYLKEQSLIISAERVTDRKQISFGGDCIYIDAGRVKGALRIRSRRNGDRFRPFGLDGTKKLKDFFIDRKVPRDKRDSIPLLVDEDNIIWVIGYQLSEDYKITPETKDILKFKVEIPQNTEVNYAGQTGEDFD